MNDAEKRTKEVYARFGLAVYYAQVLEHGLVNAMLCLQLLPNRQSVARDQEQWGVVVDGFMDRQFQKTLGRMINALRDGSDVPLTLEVQLSDALEKRNWLIHRYFRERAEEFVTPDGCARMIEELEGLRQVFEEADRSLDQLVNPVRERYGITEEWIERELSETLRKAT